MDAWLGFLLIVGVARGFGYSDTATATSCLRHPYQTAEQIRGDVEAELDRAAAVFVGEVESVDYEAVVMRVEKVWKGDIGREVRMRPRVALTTNGRLLDSGGVYDFRMHKKYVVFGMRDSVPVMTAGACGLTRALEEAAGTIQLLDTIVAIQEGGTPDSYARFLALERSWMNALATRDMPALEALVAEGFTFVWPDTASPVSDRAKLLRRAAEGGWPPQSVRLVKLHDRGDWAVVHCVVRGTFPPDHVTREGGDLFFMATDVWVKRGTTWQVLSRQLALIGT